METLQLYPTCIQPISDELFREFEISIAVKREDLVHPVYGGNKWHKLKYNLQEAKREGFAKVLTFGGAFSNHIAATAAACNQLGMQSVGVIRGEATAENNPTLQEAKRQGMYLHFVSRTAYREKQTEAFLEQLKYHFGAFYVIPEGGANALGVKGCEEILDATTVEFSHIITACGTGTTLAGLINSAKRNQEVIGVPVFKNGQFIAHDVAKLSTTPPEQVRLFCDYGFGGYAKSTDVLISFINKWGKSRLPLDPIYTGKAFYATVDQIAKGYFPPKSRILFIHTGGLQGIMGYNELLQNNNKETIVKTTRINYS